MSKDRVGFSLQTRPLTARQKAVVLPAMVVVGAVAVGLAIWGIAMTPLFHNGSQPGVAANGFTAAFAEKGTDLGVGKLVQKDAVVSALGSKAKSVSDADVTSVLNYNGDRSQMVTYNFTRSDNQPASVYIDMTQFKNQDSMDAQQILTETAKAPDANGKKAYYMHFQTIGIDLENRLVVLDGLKAYKFVMVQPYHNVTISEVAALASLVKIAQSAKF